MKKWETHEGINQRHRKKTAIEIVFDFIGWLLTGILVFSSYLTFTGPLLTPITDIPFWWAVAIIIALWFAITMIRENCSGGQ